MMTLFHKKVNYFVFLIILFIACNQAGAKTNYNKDFVGSPKITVDLPEGSNLLCQDGWVDVSYDIDDTSEIVNIHILRSEPADMFDQYVLDAFKKLKHNISRAKPVGLKGIIHRFTFVARDSCK